VPHQALIFFSQYFEWPWVLEQQAALPDGWFCTGGNSKPIHLVDSQQQRQGILSKQEITFSA
jgi:hypothetical protein